jgi:UDP-N-acetyl-D-glucosamine dehydrogenase
MPDFAVRGIADALNDRRKCLKGAKILGLGAAYKRDTNDVRESPAVSIMEALRDKGASICFSDPYVPAITIKGQALKSLSLTAEILQSMDCAAILTDHSTFDYGLIANSASLIFDTRNALKNFPKANVVRL